MHYFTLRQESEPISVCCNILYHEDEQSILGIWTALSRSRNGRGTRGERERERGKKKKGEYEKKVQCSVLKFHILGGDTWNVRK